MPKPIRLRHRISQPRLHVGFQRTKLTAIVLFLFLFTFTTVLAAPPGYLEPANVHFQQRWEWTDKPVADLSVSRTWMWGPGAFTNTILEEYDESPDRLRQVQYFDKSRMEIIHPNSDAPNLWYVTNGLLVKEMMTGMVQVGDDQFEPRTPSLLNVAGDPGNPETPSYATLNQLTSLPPLEEGQVVIQTLDADGSISIDNDLAQFEVRASHLAEQTGHRVADPFWAFMNASGPVWNGEALVDEQLFLNPYYAVGLPLTEAYWVKTTLGGEPANVLVQAFERRLLTYTPSNPAGWQVESGNIGRHYFDWRYGSHSTENEVVATIMTGPDTVRYFVGGNPLPGQEDWGPGAMSVAPDGTWWLADSVDNRLVQFGLGGIKLGEIDLSDQLAATIMDVDARSGTIWVSWANLNFGIYKLQAYTPDGTRLVDYDLPESIWDDRGYLPHGIAVVDNGQVLMELELGSRFVRLIDSAGQHDATPVDGWTYFGRLYRPESEPGEWTSKRLHVGEHVVELEANPGAFALESYLLPGPTAESFYVARYSVYDFGDFDPTVEHRKTDGTLLGVTTVPMDNRYVYVQFPYSVGPEGRLYMLMTYQDRLEILRLGFVAP